MTSKDRPNILLIMTDQQRPDSLGCYGSKIAHTEHIDKLASEGILFENCYVQNPLCCPSRYSLATGRYPHNHGVRCNWYAPHKWEKSFAHRVGRAAYKTAAIGKMHYTPWYDNFGFDGRIIAEGKGNTACPDDYSSFLKKYGLSRKDVYDMNESYFQNCTAVDSKLPQELHIDYFIGRSGCEYINRLDPNDKFCCFISFVSPHNPYDPPEPYNEMFRDADFPPRNMTLGEVNRKPREAYHYINNRLYGKWKCYTDQLSQLQLQLMKANYYATNTLIDEWVGKIIDTLKQRGLYDNTIIIYTSDHGDLLGDHGLVFKQCFYEQSVKVPLIVCAPKYFSSSKVSDLVEMFDIYSTICEMCGVWEGYGIQAKSLVPLLKQIDGYEHRDAVFSENWFGKMIRCRNWKMVYYTAKPYGELYNLEDDPMEQNNLWDDDGYTAIKSELKLRLLDWMAETEDSLPMPVRPDHTDKTPEEYELKNGGTFRAVHQPWHLVGFEDLYSQWNFTA